MPAYSKPDRKRKLHNGDEKPSSNTKRELRKKRQSHRPHFGSVETAKELWNKLRVKGNSQNEIKVMMEELMRLLTGKFMQIALQHDASRVVQAALQFGNLSQRKIIVEELCEDGNIVKLAQSQYAHFVVLKMIKYCVKDDDTIQKIIKSLKGQFTKLAVHAVGARVVEIIFATIPNKFTCQLKLQFYGSRFGLFYDGVLSNNNCSNPTIHTIIENQPSGKDSALESLLSIIDKGIDKGLYTFAYFHQIMFEYVTTASPNDIRSLCSSLVDHSIHILTTKPGSRVIAECCSYGTPKDRKRIMKSLKGYTRSSLLHSDAYIALLRILDVTDDTVHVQKTILAELKTLPKAKKKEMNVLGEEIQKATTTTTDADGDRSPILDLVLSNTGSKIFLFLLSKDESTKKKYFDPEELDTLRPNPTIKEGNDLVPTSKKNPKTRRLELLQYLKEVLIDCCITHTEQILTSRCGAKVLREVYITFCSTELTNAIVEACDKHQSNKCVSLFEHPIGHLSIKNIIQSTCDSTSTNPIIMALYNKYKGSMIDDIGSSNRGAFVLAAMIESKTCHELSVEIHEKLGEVKKKISESKKHSKPYSGYEALLKNSKD